MTHYLYRFLAASWKFCMVIVVVFVGIPGADFSSDFLLLAILFAAAIVLQDMPRAVRRGGVALCAAAFAAVYYVAWRELLSKANRHRGLLRVSSWCWFAAR
jgi:hypothetical protein